MNLFDLLTRKDKTLSPSPGTALAKQSLFAETWRGISLPVNEAFRILDVGRFYPLKARPDFCGWYFVPQKSGCDLHVGFVAHGTDDVVSSLVLPGRNGVVPVRLPWPFDGSPGPSRMDLVVRAVPATGAGLSPAPVFIAAQRALSRAALYEAAKGVGVEIGPGQKPQIMPAPDVDVAYVEQMPPDEWNRLYNTHGKYPVDPSTWDLYKIGDASNLPVEDGTLDFIFASHVFEHLANPFGHLRHWHSKLKSGGLVLCIVPDLFGTKDSQQVPSRPAEWLREYDENVWEPEREHYARHMRVAMPDHDVGEMMAQRRSIHVHYFTNRNMTELLEMACERFGFAWYQIEHTANHKDFHFILAKA